MGDGYCSTLLLDSTQNRAARSLISALTWWAILTTIRTARCW
jgi:hypothetical protein